MTRPGPVAMALLFAVSCSGEPRRAERVGLASPEPTVSPSDEPVLEAALADLVTYVGKDSPVAFHGAVETPLLVAPEPADWPVTTAAVLKRHEPQSWQAFPLSEQGALAEAADNLVARTTRHAGFVGFRSKNPRVKMLTPGATPAPKYSFLAVRPIRIWPPGYSAERRLAVVRMSIPWSIHHADGTYVFANRQGSWLLLVRQFVYYP